MAGGSKLRREVGVVRGFPGLRLPDALTESSSPSRNTPAQCHTPPTPHPALPYFQDSEDHSLSHIACYQIAFSLFCFFPF